MSGFGCRWPGVLEWDRLTPNPILTRRGDAMRIQTPLLRLKPIPPLDRPDSLFMQERLAVGALFASGSVGLAFVVYLLFSSSTPTPAAHLGKPIPAVKPFVPPPDSYPVPIRLHSGSGGYPLPGQKVSILSFPPAKEKEYALCHVRNV